MNQTPERIHLTADHKSAPFHKPVIVTNSDAFAVTIVIIDADTCPVILKTTAGAHMYIYKGLEKCGLCDDKSSWADLLKDSHCEVIYGELTGSALDRFLALMNQDQGFPRYSVVSARLWKDQQCDGHDTFSILAFWNDSHMASMHICKTLARTFQLKGSVFVAHAKDKTKSWIMVD